MVDSMERYKPLYEACVKGDWDSVKRFVEDNPDPNLWTTRIDTSGNPALCVAALSGQTKLIRNLVELMPEEALLATGFRRYTALHSIARNGDVEAAKILVPKNPRFTQISNSSGETPLLLAARLGCKQMVQYLVTVTKDEACDGWPSPFSGKQGAALLVSVINFDFYDVALDLVKKYEGLATAKDSEGMSAIRSLAKKCWPDSRRSRDVALDLVQKYEGLATAKDSEGMSAIRSLAKKCWPDSRRSRGFTISSANFMYEKYLELIKFICRKIWLLLNVRIKDLLEGAVEEASMRGGIDFIKFIINFDSREIWSRDQYYSMLLRNAIKYRQKEIFHYLKHLNFNNELSTRKISNGRYTMLHLAAKISPSRVLNKIPGAALQVQHDVKWYKEVAAMVPFYEDIRDRKGWTPEDIFYEEHRVLMREGEKWMQNIASSSMVVATLIATVVFAAAFTIPGGTRSDMGLPFFLNKRSYLVFAVSDAMALVFSLTSVLIFLSILTSTYDIEDFLVSLPRRLIIGEAMLFFAIATMTMAFGATYFIMLGHKLAWLSILIAFFISLPVILFVILQARLFAVIFKSTYTSSL